MVLENYFRQIAIIIYEIIYFTYTCQGPKYEVPEHLQKLGNITNFQRFCGDSFSRIINKGRSWKI